MLHLSLNVGANHGLVTEISVPDEFAKCRCWGAKAPRAPWIIYGQSAEKQTTTSDAATTCGDSRGLYPCHPYAATAASRNPGANCRRRPNPVIQMAKCGPGLNLATQMSKCVPGANPVRESPASGPGKGNGEIVHAGHRGTRQLPRNSREKLESAGQKENGGRREGGIEGGREGGGGGKEGGGRRGREGGGRGTGRGVEGSRMLGSEIVHAGYRGTRQLPRNSREKLE
jgi:hypothetical protein